MNSSATDGPESMNPVPSVVSEVVRTRLASFRRLTSDALLKDAPVPDALVREFAEFLDDFVPEGFDIAVERDLLQRAREHNRIWNGLEAIVERSKTGRRSPRDLLGLAREADELHDEARARRVSVTTLDDDLNKLREASAIAARVVAHMRTTSSALLAGAPLPAGHLLQYPSILEDSRRHDVDTTELESLMRRANDRPSGPTPPLTAPLRALAPNEPPEVLRQSPRRQLLALLLRRPPLEPRGSEGTIPRSSNDASLPRLPPIAPPMRLVAAPVPRDVQLALPPGLHPVAVEHLWLWDQALPVAGQGAKAARALYDAIVRALQTRLGNQHGTRSQILDRMNRAGALPTGPCDRSSRVALATILDPISPAIVRLSWCHWLLRLGDLRSPDPPFLAELATANRSLRRRLKSPPPTDDKYP